MRLYLPLLTITLLAISLSGCELNTQGRSVIPTVPPPAEIIRPAQIVPTDRLLGLTIDRSGSPSKSQYEELLPDLIAGARARAESVDGVAVTWVANGNRPTLAERPEIFFWGRLEVAPYVQPNLEKAPTDIRFFADRRSHYLAAAREKYEREKAKSIRSFYVKVDEQLGKLKLHLLQGPTETAPCTRFSSIALRLERDDYPFSIFVTDGWTDCPEERHHKLAPAKIAGKLVVLQLARQHDGAHSDSDIRRRERFLRELFPGASVLPAYSVSQAMEFLFK